ncbi:flavin monoamine oxidase family protein [Amnibacterium kyonggiense]|uniref:Putrescine oxidase n=1 Tax=Amnibacterium kyonggiense TaxID=595671 RepID=A0A4R7FQL7_9MICO|nr:NAD(P)/FAD-dependent oxidoreductase [Amnibacterium kyonggiense]TDS79899.1 putrescine oxidase [Amnibacterium kyonggiense]
MDRIERDVVVIGAGACGLTAATQLRRSGASVIVLEARDRVGGRLRNDDSSGALLELGGQWVSPDQTALKGAIEELGLETFSRYRDGDSVYIGPDGVSHRFTGDIFPASPETQAEIERMIAVLDGLTAEIDPDRPWAHPRARELDGITWRAFLEQLSDDAEARSNVAMFTAEAMLTKPAHAFSALQSLLMAASAGSFSHLVDADFILDKRVVGGLQQVPLRLAAALGDDVLLSRPVRRITWSADGAVVEADGDLVVEARQVVLAVPPNLYDRIDYVPTLPLRRHVLHQHLSLGLVIKIHAVYEEPFWREDGLSGTAFSPYLSVHEAYDNSNHGDPRGILVGFASDARADRLLALEPDERREAILDDLARYYGERAKHPTIYVESDWGSEEWTRGAYAASFDMGGLERFGADVRTPVGPIHWASSDIAGAGYQHVDGAIRMGHWVADQVLAALAPTPA